MKIALTGAGGFIGKALQKEFGECIIINRDDSEEKILQKLQGADAVINLAGAPIIKRWSKNYKKVLYSSRIETTKKLVNAINRSGIKHFISSSAIGIYPDNTPCSEECPKTGSDFLANLAIDWEKEALKCQKPTAILRLGVVLGLEGGALAKMVLPFKLGLGGVIGSGKMVTSWIDIKDLTAIYSFILQNGLTGIFSAVSPNPVNNKTFTKELAAALNRPALLPVPEFALKLIYGEASSVLTASKEVYPKALLSAGFEFKYSTIREAFEHLIKG